MEACELMASKHSNWLIYWHSMKSGLYRTRKDQRKGRAVFQQECGNHGWDLDGEPVITSDRKFLIQLYLIVESEHKSVLSSMEGWKSIYGDIGERRCKEFEKRFGKLTEENLLHWRENPIMWHNILPVPTICPFYDIEYALNEQGRPVTGCTDDPLLLDKVKVIIKLKDDNLVNWRIRDPSRILITERWEVVEIMDRLIHGTKKDGGRRQATLPYYCTNGCGFFSL